MLFLLLIWHIDCRISKRKVIAGEKHSLAEGATAPETFRQKDCDNDINLESSVKS